MLAHRERRFEVGHPRHMGERADPADGGHLPGQPQAVHGGRALRGPHPPGQREQQACAAGTGRPRHRDQRTGLGVEADTAERPAPGTPQPQIVGDDTCSGHSPTPFDASRRHERLILN
ncbi:hypothetical protein GCM10020256_57660 [Streptomyces thermocoprophilus]